MSRPETFSVITLNTWKCDGAYRDRLALMARELAALAPDVVLLQEVFVAPEIGADTGSHLAAALAMERAYAPAREKPRQIEGRRVNSQSGLATLSRWPIVQASVLSLAADARDGERIAQFVKIAVAGEPVLFVNLHLTHLEDANALRQEQLRQILDHLASLDPPDTVVVAGDFNAPPDSAPLRWLCERSGFAVHNRIVDSPGQAWRPTKLLSSSGREPRCIDYIFSLGDARWPAAEQISLERVLDRPAAGLLPSDHAGVRAVYPLRAR